MISTSAETLGPTVASGSPRPTASRPARGARTWAPKALGWVAVLLGAFAAHGLGAAAGDEPTVPAAPTTSPSLPLTLAEALRLGAERNLELLAGAYEPGLANQSVDVALGAFDTLLTAGLEGGRRESATNFSFAGTPVTREDFASAYAGVERRLYNGGRLSALFHADRLRSNSAVVERNPAWSAGASVEYAHPLLRGAGDVAMADVRRARIAVRSADHGLAALTDDVLLRIEIAYWEVAFSRALVASRGKAEDVARSLLEVTQTRYDARVATVLDLADARAGLEARRGDHLLAIGLDKRRRDELVALVMPFGTGAAPPVLVPVDDVRAVPASDRVDPRDLDRHVAAALRGRPDLLAARSALEGRDVDVAVALDELRPRLDVVGRLAFDGLDGGFGDALAESASGQATTATLGVQFSTYVGRRSAHARVCVAQMARSQAALRLRELENRVVVEVRAAMHDLETGRARLVAAAGEVAAAREALEGEQRKEANGESTPFRVLEKEELVTAAVTREDRAAADVRIATARLWKAVGLLRSARGVNPAR